MYSTGGGFTAEPWLVAPLSVLMVDFEWVGCPFSWTRQPLWLVPDPQPVHFTTWASSTRWQLPALPPLSVLLKLSWNEAAPTDPLTSSIPRLELEAWRVVWGWCVRPVLVFEGECFLSLWHLLHSCLLPTSLLASFFSTWSWCHLKGPRVEAVLQLESTC